MKYFFFLYDYVLCYVKNLDFVVCKGIVRSLEVDNCYINLDNDFWGVWKVSDLFVGLVVEENIYIIIMFFGCNVEFLVGCSWRFLWKVFCERF